MYYVLSERHDSTLTVVEKCVDYPYAVSMAKLRFESAGYKNIRIAKLIEEWHAEPRIEKVGE